MSTPTPLPLSEPLDGIGACEAFPRLAALPHVAFFDSAARDQRLGRYSYVTADPFAFLERDASHANPLGELESLWRQLIAETRPELPPFQGGVAGVLGYELGRTLEAIPAARHDDLPTPALAAGLYDVVVAFDH